MFITSDGGSNLPTVNKTGDEYVSNTVINKALMKLITNNKVLATYLNFKFTGILDPVTNNIVSGDIQPLDKTDKDIINRIYSSSCFVNINEKTSPQVLNRVFECVFLSSDAIIKLTQTKITNFDQLIQTIQLNVPLRPSITITPCSTPSVTSSITPSPTPSNSITPTRTTTPSVTPSPTPSTSTISPPTSSYYTLRLINGLIEDSSIIASNPIGTVVSITANTPQYGYQFAVPIWSGDTAGVGNVNIDITTFTSGSSGVFTVYANYESIW